MHFLRIFSRIRKEFIAYRLIPVMLGVVFVSGCSITRNVPEDGYLLNKSNIKTDSKEISTRDMEDYLKLKPNKKILGFRFHLRLYNMANPEKNKGVNKWLKNIGEEPVIMDTNLIAEGSRNLLNYLQSKGFYNAKVEDSIYYHKKKANVIYSVYPNVPYRIKSLSYLVEDSAVLELVKKDTANCLIGVGNRFDTDLLQQERTRIEVFLKNNGYYSFSKDYITFTADTNFRSHSVNLILTIRNPFTIDEKGNKVKSNFKKFKVKRVFIYPNFEPLEYLTYQQQATLDTVYYKDIQFIFSGDAGVNLAVIYENILIRPGLTYSSEAVKKSQANLSSIRLFKFVNISFKEAKEAEFPISPFDFLDEDSASSDSTEYAYLDCYIQLTQNTLQSYQVELVGTNTTGSLGAEANLSYQHKNLFRGAEVFDFKLRGLVETAQQKINFDNTLELGGSMGLSIPKYIGPFSSRVQVSRSAPKTQVTASYSYQHRPDYTRTIASLLFGYSWRSGSFITHNVNPAEVNAITISRISDDFKAYIDTTSLKYSYISQIVTVSSYGFTFNNQNPQKPGSYTYLRYNFELSGNLLNLAFAAFNQPKNADGSYSIFNTNFSQFVRSDLNYTYNQYVDANNSFAYRIFLGVGYPYGNSKALPFEKRYFTGGANGIRAWQARALGPGSYYQAKERYPNRTADIKLEANLEYRYKLFWKVEGALFIDAGNIWSMPGIDDRKGATFHFDKFYEQLALGSGLGFRMNLGFLILRTDFGYKIFDPAINPGKPFRPWVPLQQKFMWRDITFNFGIGYPF